MDHKPPRIDGNGGQRDTSDQSPTGDLGAEPTQPGRVFRNTNDEESSILRDVEREVGQLFGELQKRNQSIDGFVLIATDPMSVLHTWSRDHVNEDTLQKLAGLDADQLINASRNLPTSTDAPDQDQPRTLLTRLTDHSFLSALIETPSHRLALTLTWANDQNVRTERIRHLLREYFG